MYGIKVPMSRDDYIWVIQDPRDNKGRTLPLLFNTPEEAAEIARAFGIYAIVVEYKTI